jgi:hypothetical protein
MRGYTLNRNGAQGGSRGRGAGLSGDRAELRNAIAFCWGGKKERDEYSTNVANRGDLGRGAIHKEKNECEVKVRAKRLFTNNPSTITLERLEIIREEITVPPEERTFLMTREERSITERGKKHLKEQRRGGDNNIKSQLV